MFDGGDSKTFWLENEFLRTWCLVSLMATSLVFSSKVIYFINLFTFIKIKLALSLVIRHQNVEILQSKKFNFCKRTKWKLMISKKQFLGLILRCHYHFGFGSELLLLKNVRSWIISILNHLKGNHGGSFFVQLSYLYVSDNFTDVSEESSWIRYIHWWFCFNPPLYFHVDNSTLASKNCCVRLQ